MWQRLPFCANAHRTGPCRMRADAIRDREETSVLFPEAIKPEKACWVRRLYRFMRRLRTT